MERKETVVSVYCKKCDMFVEIDDAGCCKECGCQILEPKKKIKKK